jgi:Uma2 family endonuclease
MVKIWNYPTLPSSRLPVWDAVAPLQARLLTAAIRPIADRLHPNGDYFIGEGVGIYWKHFPNPADGWVTPDWFYADDVPALVDGKPRRLYSKWHEGVGPTIAVELVVGDGSEERDDTPSRGIRAIHHQWIASSWYVIFGRERGALEVYCREFDNYERQEPNAAGVFEIEYLGVALGIWNGTWERYTLPWLRFFTPSGELLPTLEERYAELLTKLKSKGIDADAL